MISQPVMATLTRSALFLVVTIDPGRGPEATVRELCADLSSLLRAVGFRDLQGNLSCVMAFGSEAWGRLAAVDFGILICLSRGILISPSRLRFAAKRSRSWLSSSFDRP